METQVAIILSTKEHQSVSQSMSQVVNQSGSLSVSHTTHK